MRVDYHVKNEAGDGRQIHCKACMCYIDRERRAGKKPVLVPTVEQKQCRCKLDTACRATTLVIGTSASKRWLCPSYMYGRHRLRERGPGCTAGVSPDGLYSGSLKKSCPRQRSWPHAHPVNCA
jgi:hypothetical protein